MKPGPVLFTALLCWFFLGAAAYFSDALFFIWILTGLGMLFFVIFDFFILLLLTDRLTAERSVASALALGEKSSVTVVLRGTGGRFSLVPRRALLFDIYPDSMEVSAFPAVLKEMPGKNGTLRFEYTVLPLERGDWEFPEIQILLDSFLGCWRLKVKHPCVSRGRTFPDFKKLAGSAGDLRSVLEQTGLRDIRKRGQGMEFMSLREYQKGDSVKAIDWRATGRRRKVIVREYQEEQDQQILFLLDSGYRLHRQEEAGREVPSWLEVPSWREVPAPVKGAAGTKNGEAESVGAIGSTMGGPLRTQFDGALEASLVLSWVALKYGDSAAWACFGAEERWFPPRKGMSALSSLMQNLYNVKSAPAPSSLFSALESALARLKRRTFIIMISNFREEDGESLSWIIRHIRRHHLVLLVSLRETEAESIAKRIPADKDEALETAAAFAYLAARKRLYKTWEHMGILTLECTPGELSSALVSRYLEVKRSGIL
jgi:uncharacterized protein (DUF58 family)